ncbi:MAG: hypothetical protein KF690_05220 [Bacteroidetes bacterium]|nr:hypothetical protein [Bacteroidota bacterium]
MMLCSVSGAMAQDFRQDLEALRSASQINTAYALQLSYTNSLMGMTQPVEQGTMLMVRSGNVYYARHQDGTEYFTDNEYLVIVDNAQKNILVDLRPGHYLKVPGNEQQVEALVRFVEVPHTIVYRQLSDQVIAYSIKYETGLYDSLQLVIDQKEHIVKEQTIFYRTLMNGEPGKPVTTAVLTSLGLEPFKLKLSRDAYFSKDASGYRVSASFSEYRILNLPAE